MIQDLREVAEASNAGLEEDTEEEEAEEDAEVPVDGEDGMQGTGEDQEWDDEWNDEVYNEDDFKPASQLGPEDEFAFSSDAETKVDAVPAPPAPRKALHRCRSHVGGLAETLPGDSKESLVLPSPASYDQNLSPAQEAELASILNQIKLLESKRTSEPAGVPDVRGVAGLWLK